MENDIKNIISNVVDNHIKGINDLQLVESSLNRLLTKHYSDGFIIVTSYRADEKSIEQNNKDFAELKKLVVSKGYSFIPVYGGFIENKDTDTEREVREPALIIPNHKVGSTKEYDDDKGLYNLGLELIKRYNQDSFLYKPKGDSSESYYIDKTGNVDMTFNNKSINDLTNIYFTDLSKKFGGKNNKTSKRFTFTENLYLKQSPVDLNSAKSRYGEQFFKITTPKYQITPMDDYSTIVVSKGAKLYENSQNNNIICESTFNRLLSQMNNKDFVVITAHRNRFSKKENIQRNRDLRGVLNDNKLGVHQLVGHWRECQLKDVDYNKCPKDQLKDTIERSYLVAKPDTMDSQVFKKLMLKLMTIDGETQDAIVYHKGDDDVTQVLGPNGEVYETLKGLTLNQLGQAYSQYVKKMDTPFIFEGLEIPGSNSGAKVMSVMNIKY